MSDIRFDGEFVIVEGFWTKVRTLDLMLDAPSRRSTSAGDRRAMVHDFGDGLTINYASDYPAGVTINGARKVRGHNNGDWVDVESRVVQVKGSDVMVDSAARRTNSTPYRRAIVHDFNDGLTLNYASDYPAGVTINGARRVRGHNNGDWVDVESRVVQVKGSDVMVDSAARRTNSTPYRRAIVHDFNDGLTLNWNNDYPGGVTINGAVTMPGGATVAGQDVAATIATLTDQISALEARVAALEAAA